MSRNVYYVKSKDGMPFPMRPLTYESNFKIDEENTQAITWVSFPNFLPTYFGKKSLSFGVTIQLVMIGKNDGRTMLISPLLTHVLILSPL